MAFKRSWEELVKAGLVTTKKDEDILTIWMIGSILNRYFPSKHTANQCTCCTPPRVGGVRACVCTLHTLHKPVCATQAVVGTRFLALCIRCTNQRVQ